MKRLLLTLLYFITFNIYGDKIYTIKDGNFTNKTVWSSFKVPTKKDSVIIKHNITLTNEKVVKYLKIDSSGKLNLNNYRITIKGDLDLNGMTDTTGKFRFISKVSSLSFNSNKQDTFFIERLVTSCDSFYLNTNVNITRALKINSTKFVTNDNLILDSDSLKTARLLEINNDGYIIGKVRIKRYLPYNKRIWAYLTSPISDGYVSDWQEEILITGDFPNSSTGWTITNNSRPSLYYYDESLNIGDKNDGWVSYPNIDISEMSELKVGRGYNIYIRNNPNRPNYIDVYGLLNQHDIRIDLSFTKTLGLDSLDDNNCPNDGWQLIGNPYPSQIDWNKISKSRKVNIDNSFYFIDNSNGWLPRYYSNGVSIPKDTKPIIGSSQAFWIRTNSQNAYIEFQESDKTSKNYKFYRPTNFSDRLVRIYIYDGGKSDECVIKYNDNSTKKFDSDYDMYKFSTNDVSISSYSSDSNLLAINNVPYMTDTTELKITSISDSLKIKIEISDKDSLFLLDITNDTSIYITNDTIFVHKNNKYAIIKHVRKTILGLFKKGEKISNKYVYPTVSDNILLLNIEKGDYKVSIYSLNGENIYNGNIKDDYLDLTKINLSSGIYIINVYSGEEMIISDKFIKN